ncbi:hypothetical protein D3C81_2202100 [compost metagenome]
MFYSYYGIPDKGDFKGGLTILTDGNVRVQYNDQYNNGAEPINIPLDKVNEIKITVSGNAKLWDVGFSEMKHWWD